MAKHNRKGRSTSASGRFLMLDHYLLNSPAWLSLSGNARAAYIEVAKLYNSFNNGKLAMSARKLEARLPISRQTGSRVLKELVNKGFLEVVAPSAFSYKMKRAAEYRLTIHKCDVTGKLPSKAFMKWPPPEKKSRPHETTSSASPESQNAA